jgi:hypothetical protein
MGAAFVLFAIAALLTHTGHIGAAQTGLPRFLVLSAGAGCAIAMWGSAVMMASVHKKAWPLLLAVGIVVCAGLSFAFACLAA